MLSQNKFVPPNIFDFTEQNKAWELNKTDPERLLYITATGTGAGMKTGDLIVHKYEDRIAESIINFIEYPEKEKFRLTMIFVKFLN